MLQTSEEFYRERLHRHEESLAQTSRLSASLSLARVGVFITGAAAWGAFFGVHSPAAGVAGAGLTAVFIGLLFWHHKVVQREEQTRARKCFCEQGLLRNQGELAALPARGERFLSEPHAYAHDLDLFGKNSLLQLLDAMGVELSEERLALWLRSPAPPETIRTRQEAVQEFAETPLLCEEIFVLNQSAAQKNPQFSLLLAWCSKLTKAPFTALIWAFVLPATTLFLIFFGPRLGLPPYLWALSFSTHFLLSRILTSKTNAGEALAAAAGGAQALGAYAKMIRMLTTTPWRAALLQTWAARLGEQGASAQEGLARLERLAAWSEARESEFFRAFIGPLIMYDVHLAAALERWRARYGPYVEQWLDALADLSALASLGVFAFENPDYAFPELRPGTSYFETEGLGHPLLPAVIRISNDVTLHDRGTALLVTGSNMSGKSTLLRAMGLAAVMAQAGAPVCAKRLIISSLSVRTSIRISDSLSSGVSHFYAELLALRQVIEAADRGEQVFFLLDEILHGTNSRERHIGAQSVILYLLEHHAMGAVSTHDLALAELVEKTHGRVRPVYLVEQAVEGNMVFDYQLHEGFLRSGNALHLMRQLGLPVPPENANDLAPLSFPSS